MTVETAPDIDKVALKKKDGFIYPLKMFLTALSVLWTTITVIILCAIFNLLQILLLITVPFNRQFFYQANCVLAMVIWNLLQLEFEVMNSSEIEYTEECLDLPDNESAFIISNHLASGDFYLIHSIANRKNMLGYCKYFCKDPIKYIPFFGWGMWIMGNIFLKRSWNKDKEGIERAFYIYSKYKYPAWIVSFVEGGRLSDERKAECEAYCSKKGLPPLNNVLLPRSKGFSSTVLGLRNTHFKAIYDFTIASQHDSYGFGESPSLAQINLGCMQGYRFHVHVKRYLFSELPQTEIALGKWLQDRYYEKDAYLESLKMKWTKFLINHNNGSE